MVNKKLLKNKSELSKFGTNFINSLVNIRYQGEFATVNSIRDSKSSDRWDPHVNSTALINKILTASNDGSQETTRRI